MLIPNQGKPFNWLLRPDAVNPWANQGDTPLAQTGGHPGLCQKAGAEVPSRAGSQAGRGAQELSGSVGLPKATLLTPCGGVQVTTGSPPSLPPGKEKTPFLFTWEMYPVPAGASELERDYRTAATGRVFGQQLESSGAEVLGMQ